MRLGLHVGYWGLGLTAAEQLEVVREAEAPGYDSVWNALVRRYGFEDAAREVEDLYLDGKKEKAAAALPAELIDMVSLCGTRDRVAERLEVYREAGVGTLICTPMVFDSHSRRKMVHDLAELAA